MRPQAESQIGAQPERTIIHKPLHVKPTLTKLRCACKVTPEHGAEQRPGAWA
ncbi:MAG: hypothetical protein OXD47_02560 [Gammaproteobacteria bacterium]|nr:hypothetical protein [Gammaproteobacteria bacterium]MCY4282852.1 hypothetical protein [Gammaproteobacteria bacterium]MCY4337661.1 hypothetical protein [Gammaproteobacteria bacterium]